ncbi:50S ribosomal protein L19-2, chloroplastic-like [Salvia miltiorrhiza]|uniref:50S ribosomal protein L19-2, chloroplastic-like n=1 Tax=Salvia miltiorrhiza TaxID=226208 RepID=UPI0025ABDD7B|nr:50S ribosomal protein L19-2, chloroplastic-like [Salvia miltiorrhiza]
MTLEHSVKFQSKYNGRIRLHCAHTSLYFASASTNIISESPVMSSNFLPQTLFVVPRCSAQCQPKSLALSAAPSRRPSAGGLASRISTRPFGFNFAEKDRKLSFLVRAETNPEAEAVVEESQDNADSVDSEEAEVLPDDKPPSKPRIKLGDIMGILNKKAIEASDGVRPTPDLRTGDIVEIKLEVPENRRRLSIYKGIVISKQNAGIHTTIRIRRVIAGVGVEIVFPVYSPNIKEIKVIKHRKVRRARLYYLRDKLPRLSTFK